MKKKMMALFLAFSLAFVSLPVQAARYTKYDMVGSAVQTFERDGVSYYDVEQGKTTARTDVDNIKTLAEKALYTPIEGTDYSPAQYWASLATGIFSSNPSSWREYGNDSKHGSEKTAGDFKDRFSADPKKKKNDFGNLYEALTDTEANSVSTKNTSAYRKRDINMKSTGLVSAKNLNQVQDHAYELLVDINDRQLSTKQFKKTAPLEYMTNHKDSDGTVLYQLMATRDRIGKTYHFIYNCFGIAYYDFTISPFTGENGEGFVTAIDGYDSLEEAEDAVGSGVALKGFNANSNATPTSSYSKNEGTSEITDLLGTEWQNEHSMGSEFSTMEGFEASYGESGEIRIFDESNPIGLLFGFEFTQSQLFEETLTESESVSQSVGSNQETTVTIPGHTKVMHTKLTENGSYEVAYDCPVKITYKVAIFSYNGEYYDDNAATYYTDTAGYEHRSFITTFGPDGNGNDQGVSAFDSLRDRLDTDTGSERANALTRGIRNKYSSNDDATWDTPWVRGLDFSDIETHCNNVKQSGQPDYSTSINTLCDYAPMSVTGGKFTRTGTRHTAIVGEAMQMYPLKEITLTHAENSDYELKVNTQIALRSEEFELNAFDSEGGEFHAFTDVDLKPEISSWYLCDKNGQKVNSSNVIQLTKDANGDYFVRGLKEGVAYIKYGIKDNYFTYLDTADVTRYINSADVKTPMIKITVTPNKDAPNSISVPEKVSAYYTAPNSGRTKIDLETVPNLEAAVYNEDGNVLKMSPVWQLADTNQYGKNEGISIDDNVMTVYEDGVYSIIATVGEVKSAPVSITVEETAVSKIIVPEETVNIPYTPEKPVKLEEVEGLTAIPVNQMGEETSDTVTWCNFSQDGISINGNKMTVEDPGVYELVAMCGSVLNKVQVVCTTDSAVEGTKYFLKNASSNVSLGEACLFVKNRLGQESTVNEIIYSDMLLQLAGYTDATTEQKEIELQAIVWAYKKGYLKAGKAETVIENGGVTKLQFAMIAYRAFQDAKKDVSYEKDFVTEYGIEHLLRNDNPNLKEEQKNALNWITNLDIISDAEKTAKTIDVTRVITDTQLKQLETDLNNKQVTK